MVIRNRDQGIIINFEKDFVEVHDGNASIVAWVLYRRSLHETTLWKDLLPKCDPPPKEILHGRVASTNEIWHPYVPGEVHCADRLQIAPLDEKGKQSRKALTLNGTPVYFNDVNYFDGIDKSETIGRIAETLESLPE